MGQINSYTKKMDALLAKGFLSSSMLFGSYDKDMSEMLADQQYWIIVLAKSPDYKFKTGEPQMPTVIKVWDTKIEKWVNTIKLPHYINAKMSCMQIDYKHQLIMFAAITDIHDRGYIYGFLKNAPLANPILMRRDVEPEPILWKIINDTYLLFRDEGHWSFYELNNLKNLPDKRRHSCKISAGVFYQSHDEMFGNVKEILKPHAKLTVFLINAMLRQKTFVAVVCSSFQEDPVAFDQYYTLLVELKGNLSAQINLDGNTLSIGTHKIDVSLFIK